MTIEQRMPMDYLHSRKSWQWRTSSDGVVWTQERSGFKYLGKVDDTKNGVLAHTLRNSKQEKYLE